MKAILIMPVLIFLFGCKHKMGHKNMNAIYDGKKFENIEPFPDKGMMDILKWKFSSSSTTWPDKVENQQYKVLAQKSEDLIITVINHATVLIQMNGINIITDPVYSTRVSPLSFVGPKRAVNPGVAFEDLPSIDIVLISHNHYDHLDLDTLKKISKRDNPQIFVGLKTKQFLNDNQISNVKEFDWWQKERVEINKSQIEISFVPAQHWSARGVFDKREMLWGGFVIEGNKRVYFAGDTGYGKFFKMIHEKYKEIDLALLPIGAYEPRWFMKYAHMNPEDAVQAMLDLEASKAVGIHFGTFQLTDEGISDPVKLLKETLLSRSVEPDRFIAPIFGKAIRY